MTLNLRKGIPSISIGPGGAKVTIGRRGTRVTAGLPGTGLSVSRQIPYGADVADPPEELRDNPRVQQFRSYVAVFLILWLLIVLTATASVIWFVGMPE